MLFKKREFKGFKKKGRETKWSTKIIYYLKLCKWLTKLLKDLKKDEPFDNLVKSLKKRIFKLMRNDDPKR